MRSENEEVASPNHLARRLLPALALLMTVLADTDQADAACTPAAPVNNTTVTCTGDTDNQNDPAGYGTFTENGLTINVESGASVTGTRFGVNVDGASGSNTINNLGTISGVDQGVLANVTTINNSGAITSSGNRGIEGVNITLTNAGSGVVSGVIGMSLRNATVTNLGVITGTQNGIELTTTGTIENSGTISAVNGRAILAGAVTLNNLASGVLTAGQFGIEATTANVTNAGVIESTGVNGAAINLGTGNIANSGTIVSAGANTRAISTTGDANVTNNSGGTISGRLAGIQVGGSANVSNAQGAVIEATEPTFGANAIFGSAVSVQNSGTIRSLGASASGIVAGDGGLTVNNTNTGVISATRTAISSGGSLSITGNEGRIEANSLSSFAILGQNDVSVINGLGTIRAFGGNSIAIASNGTATVANNGGLIQTFDQDSSTIFATNVKITGNTGIIGAAGVNGIAVRAIATADVTNNSGVIESRGNNGIAIASNGTATVANVGGLIQTLGQDSSTISGANVKITGNTGTIEATGVNGIAIEASDTADVTNSRTIQSIGDGGSAIQAGNAVINNNAAGTIRGNSGAIRMGAGTINNAGTLLSTKPDNSIATVLAVTSATVNNTGVIAAPSGGFGIDVRTGRLDLVNSGIIFGIGRAIAAAIANVTNTATIDTSSDSIFAQTANIQNSGLISSANSAISINNGVVNNLGTIQASGNGITIDNGTISNSGSISGAVGVHPLTFAMISNSGVIQGIGPTGFGIFADNSANVFNTGTVSGNIGIQANGLNNAGAVIINASTIEGTGGTAIKLSPAADTLTLLSGSSIIGLIDMGGGADTININTIVPASRVSSLTTLLPANTILQNVINFTGTVNALVTGAAPGMPSVVSQTQFATLDPTAFGQADRTLMGFTGGVASLVQGRLGGTAANVSGMQVVSFAPTQASDRTNEAFAAISAMAYGAERGRMPGTAAYGHAPYAAPYNVWVSGFGGTRTQKADDIALRSASSAWGGVIGIDRQLRSDLLLGAFAGGGTGRLSVDLSSQSVDTDYFVGGVYGRFDWVSHFLDFTLQAGGIANKSTRLVLNSLAPGGSENATASYNGWYVSPELAYGLRYGFGNGYTVTPVARLRYLAGALDGYSEAGSEQNLVVGRRSLNDLEERAEIELSKITGFSTGALKTSVHAGVIALQRLGSPTINTVLIGQDLSFTTPGKDSAVGVVAGAGIDVRTSANMSLFGAFEGTVMSDNSRTAAAKAGLKFAF